MGDETKEKMAFKELKKRMKGDMETEMYEDDHLFNRFLIARDFKVDNAETMLRQHLEWRKKFDVKNILKWDSPEILKKYFYLIMLGQDKDGSFVKYTPFGKIDLRGIFESSTLEDWLKRLIYIFEEDAVEMKKISKMTGKTVDKVAYISNLEHFTLSKATDKKVISNMVASINMYLNNYPETLKIVYVINAPVYFNIFFSLMKPFLPSTVVKKIRIYSDDSWRKDILDAIDAEVIPAFLGGKRTDPDGNPLCQELIPITESVPEIHYISKSKRSFPTLQDAEIISVSRASLHEVTVDVEVPGSHLEWEFDLKSGDIKFGLYYKDVEGTKTELIPLKKLDTKHYTESGLYKCEKAGSYVVLFDNTYNFLKGKEICYKIKVKDPREEESDLTT